MTKAVNQAEARASVQEQARERQEVARAEAMKADLEEPARIMIDGFVEMLTGDRRVRHPRNLLGDHG